MGYVYWGTSLLILMFQLCSQNLNSNPSNWVNMFRLSYKVNGFTLIEIMVVMIIIGVILTFTTLSIGDGGASQKLEQEAQRLASLLTMASTFSILQSKEMGVSFDIDSYHFCVFQEQRCQPIRDDIFRPRKLPPFLQMELHLEGEPIVLNVWEKNAPQYPPQLLLLSSGEFTPFEAIFSVKSNETPPYRLVGTATGKMSIQQDELF